MLREGWSYRDELPEATLAREARDPHPSPSRRLRRRGKGARRSLSRSPATSGESCRSPRSQEKRSVTKRQRLRRAAEASITEVSRLRPIERIDPARAPGVRPRTLAQTSQDEIEHDEEARPRRARTASRHERVRGLLTCGGGSASGSASRVRRRPERACSRGHMSALPAVIPGARSSRPTDFGPSGRRDRRERASCDDERLAVERPRATQRPGPRSDLDLIPGIMCEAPLFSRPRRRSSVAAGAAVGDASGGSSMSTPTARS